MNKQDLVLLFATLTANVILGFYFFIFAQFLSDSVTLIVGVLTISLLMFFAYKKLNHQFWLKSYAVIILGFTVPCLMISELDAAFSAYLITFAFITILILSHKHCHHQYWLVLPIIFFFQPFGTSWILFKIQQIVDEPEGYLEHLETMWSQLDPAMFFELFLPLIASAIALFILNSRKNSLIANT